MSPCYRPRLGAAEIEAIKASTGSGKVLSHYWPLGLPQLNSGLSHPPFTSGGNAYSKGGTGKVLEGRELAKSEGDRCR